MSPNQHFPHAIRVPSHSRTLHPVAHDPLEHSCVRPSPCPPRRGHCVNECEGRRLGPGWLSQQDSSWLPVGGSSPSSLIPRATPPRLCGLRRWLAFCTPRRTELWDLTRPLSKISGGSGADLNAKDNYIIRLSPSTEMPHASATSRLPFRPFP